MPKPSITSAQNRSIETGFIDLIGDNSSDFKVVKLETLANSLEYVAAVYANKLAEQLRKKDADSSGKLADSIQPTKVEIMGKVYSVSITAKKYAKFIDEGVQGWAGKNGDGSKYKFKSRGVDPKGEMVKSVKAWLVREAKMATIENKPISARESKRKSITDTRTKAAIRAAYMIKRQGIKPTHFWADATKEMDEVIAKEFSAALRVDIIQNLTK